MDHFTFSDLLSRCHERIESKLQNKSENVSTHDMYCIDRANRVLYKHTWERTTQAKSLRVLRILVR